MLRRLSVVFAAVVASVLLFSVSAQAHPVTRTLTIDAYATEFFGTDQGEVRHCFIEQWFKRGGPATITVHKNIKHPPRYNKLVRDSLSVCTLR